MTQTRFPQRSPHVLNQKGAAVTPPSVASRGAEPGVETGASPRKRAYHFTKRVMDVTLAAIGLAALSPLIALVALAIKLDSKGPVFFKQKRVGRNGAEFGMYKFRTMRPDAEEMKKKLMHLNERNGPVFKMANDPRITRLGRFLRKYSIDEAPQLLNVLKGEMSLVGPRPPLPGEVALYKPHHFRRLEVTPGITGLWQVTARNVADFEEWVRLDAHYIDHQGLFLDLWIMLRTPKAILSGKGAC